VTPTATFGSQRDAYGRAELLVAEESSHRLSDSTNLHQKLTLFPNLRDTGKYRAVFDVGVTVAVTTSMNLTAGSTTDMTAARGTVSRMVMRRS
jgi:putative salt-induced outer membrane protein